MARGAADDSCLPEFRLSRYRSTLGYCCGAYISICHRSRSSTSSSPSRRAGSISTRRAWTASLNKSLAVGLMGVDSVSSGSRLEEKYELGGLRYQVGWGGAKRFRGRLRGARLKGSRFGARCLAACAGAVKTCEKRRPFCAQSQSLSSFLSHFCGMWPNKSETSRAQVNKKQMAGKPGSAHDGLKVLSLQMAVPGFLLGVAYTGLGFKA